MSEIGGQQLQQPIGFPKGLDICLAATALGSTYAEQIVAEPTVKNLLRLAAIATGALFMKRAYSAEAGQPSPLSDEEFAAGVDHSGTM